MSLKKFLTSTEIQDFVAFLKYRGKKHRSYYHYTSLQTLETILKSKRFRFTRGDNEKLNDLHEYGEKGDARIHECSYFACFTTNHDESIAMWKLYSKNNPNIVRIKIPQKAFQTWFNNINLVTTFCNTPRLIKDEEHFLSDISYVRLFQETNEIQFTWKNHSYSHRLDNGQDKAPLFTSLIKNIAWKFEEECRAIVRFSNPNDASCPYIYIPISENLISSFQILAGPEFSENALQSLKMLCRQHNIKIQPLKSQVHGKVNLE